MHDNERAAHRRREGARHTAQSGAFALRTPITVAGTQRVNLRLAPTVKPRRDVIEARQGVVRTCHSVSAPSTNITQGTPALGALSPGSPHTCDNGIRAPQTPTAHSASRYHTLRTTVPTHEATRDDACQCATTVVAKSSSSWAGSADTCLGCAAIHASNLLVSTETSAGNAYEANRTPSRVRSTNSG